MELKATDLREYLNHNDYIQVKFKGFVKLSDGNCMCGKWDFFLRGDHLEYGSYSMSYGGWTKEMSIDELEQLALENKVELDDGELPF